MLSIIYSWLQNAILLLTAKREFLNTILLLTPKHEFYNWFPKRVFSCTCKTSIIDCKTRLNSIPEACAKIVYSFVSTKRERVTRCLQHLESTSHERHALTLRTSPPPSLPHTHGLSHWKNCQEYEEEENRKKCMITILLSRHSRTTKKIGKGLGLKRSNKNTFFPGSWIHSFPLFVRDTTSPTVRSRIDTIRGTFE